MSMSLLQRILGNNRNLTSIRKTLQQSSSTLCRHSHLKPRLKMNQAFLRYEKGNETFELSFRYVNPELKVDKLCHFSRRAEETVENFVKRIDTNVTKVESKKKQKRLKKKKNNAEERVEPILQENVATNEEKIMFLRENGKIDGNAKCQVFLEDASNVILRVFGSDYVIKYNAPWVLAIKMPKCILANFPVYPVKFETLYTCRDDCIFTWFRGNRSVPVLSENHWEKVGEGFMYVASNEDIGCFLKLRCEPRNGLERGPAIEVETPARVEAGPGHCPFETRHLFASHKLSGKRFRVMSYNILADTYADQDFSRETLFPYCPAYALEISYRKQLFLKEIIGFNADIICLQEVDTKVFNQDLQPNLLNFEGHYTKKGTEHSEGLATFYNMDRFEKIHSDLKVMSRDVDEMEKFRQVWSKIENQGSKERFLARNTTIQVTVVRSKENPEEILVVGNLHLYFHPNADYIRLLQGYYALVYIESVMSKTKQENPDHNVSIILCGDFNSTPESGIYQLMTQKHLPSNYQGWSSCPEEEVKNISLSHDLSMASACGTPKYTNYTNGFAACLDYIYYQTDHLKVEQVIPMPSDQELALHTALPSVTFPSDHISIVADLKWN